MQIIKKALLFIFPITIALSLIVGISLFALMVHRVKGELFDSNGVSVHYVIEGEGEPVILLHGFAVNSDLNFRLPGITRALSKQYKVISMDLRGHGFSGKPHDARQYGVEMANDVIRLMDHLEIEKAHLVGYSLGGFIALKLATTHPDRFITVSPLGAGWESPENGAFLKALPRLTRDLKAGKGISPISGELGTDRKQPGFLHTFWVKTLTRFFNDKDALIPMLEGIPELTITEEELAAIPMPVCSIVGGEDGLRVGAEAMSGVVGDHTLVIIDGADHLLAPTRPEFINSLLDFLHKNKTNSNSQ